MFLDVLPVEGFHLEPPTTVETTADVSGNEGVTQVSKVAPVTFIIAFLVIVAVIVIVSVTKVINKELKNA